MKPVACALYLLNYSSSKSVLDKAPEKAWSSHKLKVGHLEIFRSIAYSHVPDERRKKLDDKSKKCIFMAYNERFKAYKQYNPIAIKFILSRDAKFNEEEY